MVTGALSGAHYDRDRGPSLSPWRIGAIRLSSYIFLRRLTDVRPANLIYVRQQRQIGTYAHREASLAVWE